MMVPASLDEVLKRFYQQPLVFEPGEGLEYSGLGYFVLAKVIEVTSGQPYGEFLQDAIFAPLGMRSTGADRPEVVLAGRAHGYVREDGALRNAPTLYVPILTGGGNLYSTVEDLLRWDRALRDGRLLSPAGYEALYRPEREHYSYGWVVHEVDGRQILEHTGGVPGFHSIIYRLPKEQLCIVVLSNVEPCDPSKIAGHLAEMALPSR